MVSEASQVCCWAHCLFPCRWLQKAGHNYLIGQSDLGRFLIFWWTMYAYTWEKRVKFTVTWGYIKIESSTSRIKKYLCSKVTKSDKMYLPSLLLFSKLCTWLISSHFCSMLFQDLYHNLVVSDDWEVFSNKFFLLILFIFTLWNVFAHKKWKRWCLFDKNIYVYEKPIKKVPFDRNKEKF